MPYPVERIDHILRLKSMEGVTPEEVRHGVHPKTFEIQALKQTIRVLTDTLDALWGVLTPGMEPGDYSGLLPEIMRLRKAREM